MSRRTHSDTIARDAELATITIPANTGSGQQLDALLGAVAYRDRIIAWEIAENDGAFEAAKDAAMSAPTLTRPAGDGWRPPVSGVALDTWYVRATGGAAVNAALILYVAREEAVE